MVRPRNTYGRMPVSLPRGYDGMLLRCWTFHVTYSRAYPPACRRSRAYRYLAQVSCDDRVGGAFENCYQTADRHTIYYKMKYTGESWPSPRSPSHPWGEDGGDLASAGVDRYLIHCISLHARRSDENLCWYVWYQVLSCRYALSADSEVGREPSGGNRYCLGRHEQSRGVGGAG